MHVPVPLRWSDIDAYRHVNNAAMLGLLEQVRVEALWATTEEESGRTPSDAAVIDGSSESSTLTLVAHQEVEYLRPIPYHRRPLDCELWIGRLGGASLDLCYEVWSPAGVEPRELTTRAATTVVLVDATTQRPRRITPTERAAWTPYLEPPVTFSKRR